MFVVIFSTFLMTCVDYPVLFYDRIYNVTHKVTLQEAIYPLDKCAARYVNILQMKQLKYWVMHLEKQRNNSRNNNCKHSPP